MAEKTIFHICAKKDWEDTASQKSYSAASLADEGFIHCSTSEQLIGTANLIFKGQSGLVLLQIDAAKVAPKIVYEDTVGAGMDFPHIYGPLNRDAVVRAIPFAPQSDGTFLLPEALSSPNQ